MKDRWIERVKKTDFDAWGKELRVNPLTARIIRNRGIETLEEAKLYLYGTWKDLSDPLLMKDMKKGAELLRTAIIREEQIAICSDFDDDGIFAGEILYEGIRKVGGQAILLAPHRVLEGYGLNRQLVDRAKRAGCSLILTCDNGIAQFDAIRYAKEQGLTVVVTDHHEVQYTEENGVREYHLPDADAVIDPHQPGCAYPYKELCGAGVAFRLIQVLYSWFDLPPEEITELLEYAAIATVADVVPLTGENRILVREGMKRLKRTEKIGLSALIEVQGLRKENMNSYHLGFVIGPCFNAVGRLSHVQTAFDLLQASDHVTAFEIASEIKDLNDRRKEMTEEGVQKSLDIIERDGLLSDRILLVYVPGIHESVVGIVAGKLKEKYHKPVFVFTEGKDGLKGSGRSIEEYHMMEGLMEVSDLYVKGGGHKMAAGVTVLPENLDAFRRKLNENCRLTEEDLIPKRYFDARMPLSYLNENFIQELDILEPFGMQNPRPTFARPHFKILSMRPFGKERQYLRLTLTDGSGAVFEAPVFDDVPGLLEFLKENYGKQEVERCLGGFDSKMDPALLYAPKINDYQGNRSIELGIVSYCVIR